MSYALFSDITWKVVHTRSTRIEVRTPQPDGTMETTLVRKIFADLEAEVDTGSVCLDANKLLHVKETVSNLYGTVSAPNGSGTMRWKFSGPWTVTNLDADLRTPKATLSLSIEKLFPDDNPTEPEFYAIPQTGEPPTGEPVEVVG